MQFADLFNYILRSTYFQHDGAIYEQQNGAAMGRPVSAVIADLYIEDFKQQVLAATPTAPKIWKRYVFSTASQCSTTNRPFYNGDWEW